MVVILKSYGQTQEAATYDIVIAYERKNNGFPSNIMPEKYYWTFEYGNTGNYLKMEPSDNNYDYHIGMCIGGTHYKEEYTRDVNGPTVAYINFKKIPADKGFYNCHIRAFYRNSNSNFCTFNYMDDTGALPVFDYHNFIGNYTINQKIVSPMGNFYIQSFKPNVSIFLPPNRDPTTGIKSICSGEQFGIFAYPTGFPEEIYNWQFSLDNKNTWREVPSQYHVANPTFTIKDIVFGEDHLNYDGKTLYFRLGYNGKVFSQEIPLIYSACAPIIKKIDYSPPLCYNDNIPNVIITFDRDLKPGETLMPFSIVRADDTSIIAKQITNPITALDGIDPNKTFSFTNFNGLENGKNYTIIYQAIQDENARGLIPTPLTFQYTEPEPLTFTIIPTDPLCHDGEGGLTINVTGGSGEYFYSLDDGPKIAFTVTTVETSTTINNITTISRSASQPITLPVTDAQKSYKIKITDKHGCIEKLL